MWAVPAVYRRVAVPGWLRRLELDVMLCVLGGLDRIGNPKQIFWLAQVSSLTAALSSAQNYRFRLARRVTSSCYAARRSNQEETHPTSGPERCAPGVRSLHRCSRGPLRRAVHGPSQLSRHPCRSTPYTPIPLTLLTGLLARACRRLLEHSGTDDPVASNRPIEEAERRCCAAGFEAGCRESASGPGWPFGARLWSSTGAREA